MLRIFDGGGYPGSRTWDGEANHTVSLLYTCKIKNFLFRVCRIYFSFPYTHISLKNKKIKNKKAEVISPG